MAHQISRIDAKLEALRNSGLPVTMGGSILEQLDASSRRTSFDTHSLSLSRRTSLQTPLSPQSRVKPEIELESPRPASYQLEEFLAAENEIQATPSFPPSPQAADRMQRSSGHFAVNAASSLSQDDEACRQPKNQVSVYPLSHCS